MFESLNEEYYLSIAYTDIISRAVWPCLLLRNKMVPPSPTKEPEYSVKTIYITKVNSYT